MRALAGTHENLLQKTHHPLPTPDTASMQDILQTFRSYYSKPAVRTRILEFLGGDSPESTTCEYITADGILPPARTPRFPEEIFARLDEGLDICRSLLDKESLIAHLDIEYVNFDFPAEAYLNPLRTFEIQEPVGAAIKRILGFYGIQPLHVLSGRGHHFAWRIGRHSKVFAELAQIGRQATLEDSSHEKLGNGHASPLIAQAFAGLGLVMEFVGRLVITMAAPECPIPIELTAVEVPHSPHGRGREMISIDLSEYGDPLYTRTVRVPFSAYLKPWQQVYAVGHHNISRIGPIIFVPMDDLDIHDGMAAMRDPRMAAHLAEHISTRIPDETHGTEHLVRHYRESALRQFHDFFYSEKHDEPAEWPRTYDCTHLDDLPPDARSALLFPNDLLLRPAGMRSVTKALLERGWHPRHIAGLIRSKFERDYGWGEQWKDYSPAMRADFYTRIFSGRNIGVDTEVAAIRLAEIWGSEGMKDHSIDQAHHETPLAAGGIHL